MDPGMTGTYNFWLVGLSFGIAMVTSYTAIALAERVTANCGRVRRAWLSGGAVAMGTGIWCMHSIGMLAFQLSIPVRYHVPTVALSLLAAILASLIALFVVSRKQMGQWAALAGTILMGAEIGALHYVGMAAMRLEATPVCDQRFLVGSVVLAMLISYVGLTLLFNLRGNQRKRRKLLVAFVLGLSVPVMHYTGMAAVDFRMPAGPIDYFRSIDISALATFAIFGLTFLMLGFAMVISVVERRMSAKNMALNIERTMLRGVIDHIPDLMYVKDVESRVLLAHVELAKRVGVTDSQFLIGKTDFDFFRFGLAAKYREDELRVMTRLLSEIRDRYPGTARIILAWRTGWSRNQAIRWS
jgi:NO-binding membrane sensor protein with MHYT domain